MQSQYSEAVIASMTLIFGDGFLSPGGEAEVKRIIQSQTGSASLAGRKVLDWGCGLGGTALAMAQQCDADDVLGIDIEPGNIRLAEDLVNRHGYGGQIAFKLRGPLYRPCLDRARCLRPRSGTPPVPGMYRTYLPERQLRPKAAIE